MKTSSHTFKYDGKCDAIRFVSSNKSRMTSASGSNEGYKQESKEPDYNEDKDQLEEEQEESAELTSAVTTNQIF